MKSSFCTGLGVSLALVLSGQPARAAPFDSFFPNKWAKRVEAPPTSSILTFTYQGCYAEPSSGRALDKVKSDAVMTVSMCQSICAEGSYAYFGVEYGKECWCGNTLNVGASKLKDSACTSKCAGDKTTTCGGSKKLNIYKRDAASAPVQQGAKTSVGQYGWQGCYVDEGNPRALSKRIGDNALTPEKCVTLCKGSKYMGLQYGRECWCGETLADKPFRIDPAGCDKPCSGDVSSKCGSGNRLDLYLLDAAPAAYVEPVVYAVGCYADTGANGHALEKKYTNDKMTVSMCANYAEHNNYGVFGVENGNNCWVGSEVDTAATKTDGCNVPCKGDKSQYCGANAKVNVYTFQPPTPPGPVTVDLSKATGTNVDIVTGENGIQIAMLAPAGGEASVQIPATAFAQVPNNTPVTLQFPLKVTDNSLNKRQATSTEATCTLTILLGTTVWMTQSVKSTGGNFVVVQTPAQTGLMKALTIIQVCPTLPLELTIGGITVGPPTSDTIATTTVYTTSVATPSSIEIAPNTPSLSSSEAVVPTITSSSETLLESFTPSAAESTSVVETPSAVESTVIAESTSVESASAAESTIAEPETTTSVGTDEPETTPAATPYEPETTSTTDITETVTEASSTIATETADAETTPAAETIEPVLSETDAAIPTTTEATPVESTAEITSTETVAETPASATEVDSETTPTSNVISDEEPAITSDAEPATTPDAEPTSTPDVEPTTTPDVTSDTEASTVEIPLYPESTTEAAAITESTALPTSAQATESETETMATATIDADVTATPKSQTTAPPSLENLSTVAPVAYTSGTCSMVWENWQQDNTCYYSGIPTATSGVLAVATMLPAPDNEQSFETCAGICLELDECHSWAYDYETKKCTFYSGAFAEYTDGYEPVYNDIIWMDKSCYGCKPPSSTTEGLSTSIAAETTSVPAETTSVAAERSDSPSTYFPTETAVEVTSSELSAVEVTSSELSAVETTAAASTDAPIYTTSKNSSVETTTVAEESAFTPSADVTPATETESLPVETTSAPSTVETSLLAAANSPSGVTSSATTTTAAPYIPAVTCVPQSRSTDPSLSCNIRGFAAPKTSVEVRNLPSQALCAAYCHQHWQQCTSYMFVPQSEFCYLYTVSAWDALGETPVSGRAYKDNVMEDRGCYYCA